MDDKLLTIIVPVYKVEPYINKCLESCLIYKRGIRDKQELDDELMNQLEVIIVNDGTPDNSAEMSRMYAKRFPDIFRQIDKENGGHGSAWNIGVARARGKYIKFLDSDDWLEHLDLMICNLRKTDADLVLAPYMVHDENSCDKWKMLVKDMEFGKVYDADRFDWVGNSSEGHYYWHQGGIYKTEILRRHHPVFLERQPYDDTILMALPVIEAKTLVAWDVPLYQYLIGRKGQSVSAGMSCRHYGALIKVRQSVIQFIESNPVEACSTKAAFLTSLLRKQYQFEYVVPITTLPYVEARETVKQWDKWVKNRNSNIVTKWIRLYRLFPFCIYWTIYRCYASIGRFVKSTK